MQNTLFQVPTHAETLDGMSDDLLHKSTVTLAREERRITADVIRHLEEIDRRKLFAAYGYSSLFAYCLKELSYSESQAYRRINAMRLSRQIPEVSEAIEKGQLHVTTASLAQDFFRLEKRESGKIYSHDEKREVLAALSGKTKREAEAMLASKRPEIASPETKKILGSGLTQIQFAADAELIAKLEQVRGLLAHQLPDGSHVALIEKMADFILKKLDPVKKPQQEKIPLVQTPPDTQAKKLPAPGKVNHHSRYIPADIRRAVWIRDEGRCTHLISKSGQRCGCTHGLQIDHELPWAMGGENTAENLRLLCRAHNARAAVVTFGKYEGKATP